MKKLKEFITWVGKQKGFEGMNSDQVITALNEMSSSEEGKAEVAKLMSAFKQDQKIGSASEVLKAQSGAALRRAQRQEYRNAMNEYRNDAEMNKYRRGYLRDMAKERANNISVSQNSSSQSPIFDKERFRDRKQVARLVNPEWNWKQRREFALKGEESVQNHTLTPDSQKTYNLPIPESLLTKSLDIPKITIPEYAPVQIDTTSAMSTYATNDNKIDTDVDWNAYTDISIAKPTMSVEQFRNHPNFRKAYSGRLGHSAPTTINIEGTEYPIAVTTGMYGNNLGIENDHTYAYDPNTGKIRKLKEDFTGSVRSSYGFEEGSDWIDMIPEEGWKYKQSGHNMNYTMPTYRTPYGKMNK